LSLWAGHLRTLPRSARRFAGPWADEYTVMHPAAVV
jgi:hypothetical protein